MKRLSGLILLIILVTSCADVITKSPIIENNILYWVPPIEFEDGTILIPELDLREYRIYYGDGLDTLQTNRIVITDTSIRSKPINEFDDLIESYAIVYISMTSLSILGAESSLSNIITHIPQ